MSEFDAEFSSLTADADALEAMIMSNKSGRELALARFIRDGKLSMNAAQVLCSRWRGRPTPGGVRGEMMRMVMEVWVQFDRKLFEGDGGGREHIGYEFLVEHACKARDYQGMKAFATAARRENWSGDWDGAIEYAQRRLLTKRRTRR